MKRVARTVKHLPPLEDLLSADEVCRKLKCSRSCLYTRIREDGFPVPVKLGDLSRWIPTEITAWLRTRARAGAELETV